MLQGLAGASALAATPDGTGVYATGFIGDGVAAFTRTPATGQLTFVESERDNVGGVDGLNGAAAVVVSGDGAQVYVAGSADNAVVAFARDAATNGLTLLELERNGFGGVTGLLGPDGLALSNDGKHLYAAAAGSSSVAIFGRDNDAASATFGELDFLGEVRDGVDGVDGLNLARGLALSPDGGPSLRRRRGRQRRRGLRPQRRLRRPDLRRIPQRRRRPESPAWPVPAAVAISPDGGQVYVAGGTANAVAHFTRQAGNASPDFGKLTFVSAYVDGIGGVDGLQGAAAVLVSPDPFGSDPGGQHVYVAGSGEDAVAVFSRNEITGALTWSSAARQGQAGVDGLAGPAALLGSPDAAHLYAAGSDDGAVVTFDRDWDGGTAGTGALAFVESDANGDGTVAPGETVSYDIVVTNHGPSGVRGALVTDVFPGELENVEWECFSLALGATCLNGSDGVGDLVDKEVRLPAAKAGNKDMDGGSIAIIPYTAGTWGTPQVIVQSTGATDNNFFPVFSPDSKWIAYVHADGSSKDEVTAILRLVPDGGGTPIEMPRLNRRVNNADGVMKVGDSMPTWAPSTKPGVFWLAFSSVRAYATLRAADRQARPDLDRRGRSDASPTRATRRSGRRSRACPRATTARSGRTSRARSSAGAPRSAATASTTTATASPTRRTARSARPRRSAATARTTTAIASSTTAGARIRIPSSSSGTASTLAVTLTQAPLALIARKTKD